MIGLNEDLNHPCRPSVEHLVSLANNGSLHIDNLQIAHRWCNSVRVSTENICLHVDFKKIIVKQLWEFRKLKIKTIQGAYVLDYPVTRGWKWIQEETIIYPFMTNLKTVIEI